jgi:dTDP-4-amino-4,6-dideoxygalactose transaminase
MWKIPLFDLSFDDEEKKAVLEVLSSKWLTMGPKTKEFEEKFTEYHENKVKCCAVSSCTAALHMALLLNDIKNGDEVILSGLTFVAALNVVSLVGATPVLADSKSFEDWNVSPEDIASKITKNTKAIIIVHYAGMPCDMDEIVKLTKDNNVILIEDVAHAIGAEYKGQKCGTFGDIACFSFFSNKNLSTGEGGMFVTANDELDRKARLFRSHGMTSLTIDRYKSSIISYDVLQMGLNYRIDEIRSALGIEQLKKLDESNNNRKLLVEKYRTELFTISGIIIPWMESLKDRTSSYHIFPVMLPENIDRNAIIEYMKDKGIQTSIHYPAFKDFSYYSLLLKQDLKIADEISRRVLTLPLYPDMREEQVEIVCKALIEAMNVAS